mmetsp:Transcript_50861/g.144112  ORF Transcript_50861/g.144112 Transcript_50861/m.144112 type:complete len:260 (-) Transcript_50861:470-1249(-)
MPSPSTSGITTSTSGVSEANEDCFDSRRASGAVLSCVPECPFRASDPTKERFEPRRASAGGIGPSEKAGGKASGTIGASEPPSARGDLGRACADPVIICGGKGSSGGGSSASEGLRRALAEVGITCGRKPVFGEPRPSLAEAGGAAGAAAATSCRESCAKANCSGSNVPGVDARSLGGLLGAANSPPTCDAGRRANPGRAAEGRRRASRMEATSASAADVTSLITVLEDAESCSPSSSWVLSMPSEWMYIANSLLLRTV